MKILFFAVLWLISFRNYISDAHLLHKQYRLSPWQQDSIVIPCDGEISEVKLVLSKQVINDIIIYDVVYLDSNNLKKCKTLPTVSKLEKYIVSYLSSLSVENVKNLKNEIPQKWEKHGNLTLFPDSSFKDTFWYALPITFWKNVASIMDSKRLAIKSKIQKDGFRTPSVIMLLGNDPIVRHIDNGITYEYDVTKLMFSKGNISEKLRIATFDCTNEIVIDMFAGIGYFVLPYIIKAKAKKVYACEWNPVAMEMLKKNLEINNVVEKCEILFGDNRQITPKGIADRVNLGLIPTSSGSWKAACQALKQHCGGVLHIHENIECKPSPHLETISCKCLETCCIKTIYKGSLNEFKQKTWCNFVESLQSELSKYFDKNFMVKVEHIEYLKSYAPHVDNLVFDVRCKPCEKISDEK